MPIALVLVCCGDREKEPLDLPGDKGSGIAGEKQADSALNVRAFGISSTDLLLPYVTNTTADGGSHFWIYSVARNGDFCRALLFVQNPSSENVVYDAYYVAYRNGKEDRISLTNEDAEREIGFIEQVLVASGVKALYDSCYAEGCLRSDEQHEAEDRELFGENSRVGAALNDDSANREIAKRTNEHTVCGIASVVRSFREANDRERLSTHNNTRSKPSIPQPAGRNASPTAKEYPADDHRSAPHQPAAGPPPAEPESEP